MIKRIIASFSVMCLLIICSSCSKTQEKGFRGIKWGATIEEIAKAEGKDISSLGVGILPGTEDHQISTCVLNESISVSKFKNVSVYYYIDNLYGLFVGEYLFNNESNTDNYTYLQQALTEKYGKPTNKDLKDTLRIFTDLLERGEHKLWEVDNTIIGLQFNQTINELRIFYVDKNFLNKLPKADTNGL